mgnify:FL=1
MKKRMSQRAGWIFVAVFVGLHLLYCALDLMRGLIIRTPPHTIDTPIYRAVERPLMVLQLFLAGPSLRADAMAMDGATASQDIVGHCLIGVFVVASTLWLRVRYGWLKTYLFWGTALALSVFLCKCMAGVAAGMAGEMSLPLYPPYYMEVPLRSARYVLLFQIPSWLLYGGLRKIFQDAVAEGQSGSRLENTLQKESGKDGEGPA